LIVIWLAALGVTAVVVLPTVSVEPAPPPEPVGIGVRIATVVTWPNVRPPAPTLGLFMPTFTATGFGFAVPAGST
jgi:hypothetical protein